ncbi:MAG: ABC transporter permease [Bacteroidales bacterium]|nr:ABC transporter permease [Bacteroidales bacterium]
MNRIWLIIGREFVTRVRKRSFVIMTLLGPVLMAALFVVPMYIATLEGGEKTIGVIDETGLFSSQFTDTDQIRFMVLDLPQHEAKNRLSELGLYAVLHIPMTEVTVPQTAVLYSDKQPSLMIKGHIRDVMSKHVESLKLKASGIDPEILHSINTSINLLTIRLNKGGEEEKSSTELSMILGMVAGLLIYFFIFLYGAQVMRGVIEEKTSRIVEIIVSSVRPFQLMMGKITGIALVGLTQFTLWVLLTFIMVTVSFTFFSEEISEYRSSQLKMQQESITGQVTGNITGDETTLAVAGVLETIESINFGVMIFTFLFFFIGGYLLYGALFAAIGSAVDQETDTQQFMLPVTVPLILSIILAQFVVANPDGPVAFWLSVIPLTSPVIMMIRIPFGVAFTDLALSALLLIAGFVFTTWLAAKVYRTGILMYGKKVNYRELWKWIRYRT